MRLTGTRIHPLQAHAEDPPRGLHCTATYSYRSGAAVQRCSRTAENVRDPSLASKNFPKISGSKIARVV
jgi:hypothetical protein